MDANLEDPERCCLTQVQNMPLPLKHFRHISSRVPKFVYFDEYNLVDGHVNIEKLKQRKIRHNARPIIDKLAGWRRDNPCFTVLLFRR